MFGGCDIISSKIKTIFSRLGNSFIKFDEGIVSSIYKLVTLFFAFSRIFSVPL